MFSLTPAVADSNQKAAIMVSLVVLVQAIFYLPRLASCRCTGVFCWAGGRGRHQRCAVLRFGHNDVLWHRPHGLTAAQAA